MQIRDRLILALSQRIYLIALRSSSSWENMISDRKNVNREFQVKFPRSTGPGWVSTLKEMEVKEINTDRHLIHWTRGVYGPWKGESIGDYLRAISETPDHKRVSGMNGINPRDGFETLCHIIQTGVVRGEGRMVREGVPMTSFTRAPIQTILKQIRYRNTLGRYNFEPYGIGINRSRLEMLGTKPVIYGYERNYRALGDEEKPFFQIIKSKSSSSQKSWEVEQEFRLIGDLDLTSLDPHDITLIVPTDKEAKKLASITTHEIRTLKKAENT